MVVKNKLIFFEETKAVILDYMWYTVHEPELDEWLNNHECTREGMIINFFDERIKILFILKWL